MTVLNDLNSAIQAGTASLFVQMNSADSALEIFRFDQFVVAVEKAPCGHCEGGSVSALWTLTVNGQVFKESDPLHHDDVARFRELWARMLFKYSNMPLALALAEQAYWGDDVHSYQLTPSTILFHYGAALSIEVTQYGINHGAEHHVQLVICTAHDGRPVYLSSDSHASAQVMDFAFRHFLIH